MSKVGTPSAPIRLQASIGGFHDGHREVLWRRGKLWFSHDRVDGSQVSVVPSAEEWARFWAVLDKIAVWGWDASYHHPDIIDGTQWGLDLSDGARSVKCSGSNRYPKSFRKFLKAVEALAQQPFAM